MPHYLKVFLLFIIIRGQEKRLGEPNFRRKREVWRGSYFVPNAAGANTNIFFSFLEWGPDTFWYILHNIRPHIEKQVILGNVCLQKYGSL